MTKTIGLIKIGHIVERSQQLLQSVTVDSCHQLPSGTNREKMNNTGTITALDCSEPTRIPTQDSGIRLQHAVLIHKHNTNMYNNNCQNHNSFPILQRN